MENSKHRIHFGALGAGPMPATIPAVSVTMTITRTTLLVPLFVFKSPSLQHPLLKLKPRSLGTFFPVDQGMRVHFPPSLQSECRRKSASLNSRYV